MPTSRSLLIVAARLAPRLQADAGRLVARLQHHREPPGRDVGQRLDVGELDAPVAGDVDLGDRPAPALRLVEMHQAFGQRLARQHLQLGVERGAHRQAAFVELLLAVAVVELAPHFLGEIFGGEGVRAGRLLRHAERRALGLFGVGRLDEAVRPPSGRSPSCAARARARAGGTGDNCSAPSAAPRDRRLPARSVR